MKIISSSSVQQFLKLFYFQVCNASLRIKGRINDDAKWHEFETRGSINSRLSLSLFEIKTFEMYSLGTDNTKVSKKRQAQ